MITQEKASEFATLHYNDVYAFCASRLKNTDDAEDVTQNVFLMFQERLQTLDDVNIRAWLFSVASRKIREEYRYRSIHSNVVALTDVKSGEYPGLLCELDDYCYISDDAVLRAKEKILGKLLPSEQELFLKIYENRKKYSEIASELDASEKTVSVRSYRLRAKIKNMSEIAFIFCIYAFIRLK